MYGNMVRELRKKNITNKAVAELIGTTQGKLLQQKIPSFGGFGEMF